MNDGNGVDDFDLYFENDFIRVYERVSPSAAPHGFLEVTKEERLFDKPTVLCLGPVDCHHGGPATANGFAKAAARIIGRRGVYDGAIRVLSITHPYSHSVPRMVEEYNEAIQYGDQESTLAWNAVRKFTEEKFGYLFSENGKLRDVEKIKMSCRNLNVITHSLGGVIIQQIGSVIHEMLSKAGVSNADIESITKEVSVFTLGNPAHLRSGKANFSQFHVYGLGDRIAYARCPENHDELFSIVQRKPQLANKNLAIVPIGESPNNVVMCIGNIAITQQQRREGDYRNIPAVIDPNMPRVHFSNGKLEVSVPEHLKGNTLEHRADTYLTFGIGTHGIMVPTAIGVALSNAVQNSIRNHNSHEFIELPSVRRLLVAPKVQDNSVQDNWVNVATKRRGGPDRLQLLQEARRRAAFDYARSDPNSEKGYSQIEIIADGIGYNQRIAEAFGERTQKGTPRDAYR